MNWNTEREANEEAVAKPIVVSRLRSALVHGSLVFFALAIIGRAVQVQLVQGGEWARVAERQQFKTSSVTPPRGRILDANGNVLVETRELVELQIVPRNVKATRRHPDARARLRRTLQKLRVPATYIARAMDTTARWVEIPGRFLPSDVQEVLNVPGVDNRRVLQRIISAKEEGIRRVLGAVTAEDVASGGIEQELDSILRGTKGQRALVRDGRGAAMETPLLDGYEARPGHTVVLTLNQSLQAISERELAAAMRRTGASGGDVVILDPRDGAVLALAGARDGRPAPASTPLTQAYEPGSVIKPLLIAHMLGTGKTHADEVINTENGKWVLPHRVITDEHKAPVMTVSDVVRNSSNIGAVKLATRMEHAEEYEVLRDFGFGVATGVTYPAESRGFLPIPSHWSDVSAASLAMGYEVQATPLQIAVAYAAVANGGEMLQASLIREIRDADDNIVFAHQRRVLRRVLPASAAASMNRILASVVDSGTGKAAQLATFDVSGKSGTSRRAINGRYVAGHYNATFAGIFPAQSPQFVIIARLVDPEGSIFGGVVAAPLVNGIIQGAIAARNGSLDRAGLAAVEKSVPVKRDSTTRPDDKNKTSDQQLKRSVSIAEAADTDSVAAPPPPIASPGTPSRVVVALPASASTLATTQARKAGAARALRANEERPVPFVRGLDLRQAVRTLNNAGFEVRLAKGMSGRTRPAAGSSVRVGATVILEIAQ